MIVSIEKVCYISPSARREDEAKGLEILWQQIMSSPGMVSIYWNDLTPAKQAEILVAFGENCNFDVFPIANIPISEEDAE